MMREILFRGKRTDNGEWVYGYYVPDMLEKTHGEMTDWAYIREHDYKKLTSIMHEVDKETVGQYTGLKDKNGVKIFEGDVVVVTYEKRPYVVECWTDGWGRYVLVQDGKYFESDLADYEDIEVIGNIHDKEDER